MMLPAKQSVKRLNKEDVKYATALKSIVWQGDFAVKGEAAITFGTVMTWLNDLDKRIEKTLEPPPPIEELADTPKPLDEKPLETEPLAVEEKPKKKKGKE